jgi:hypothetical protein
MRHTRGRGAIAVLIAVVITTSISTDHSFAKEDQSWLITPDEAALAPAEDDGIRSRGLSDAGPGIEIVKPEEGAVIPGAAEILIRFLPKTVTIDLTSLKITLLKFISIDLTDRLKPYVNLDGIAVKDAKVPTGTYRVRISLSDFQGKTSTREISFEIR